MGPDTRSRARACTCMLHCPRVMESCKGGDSGSCLCFADDDARGPLFSGLRLFLVACDLMT